MKPVLKQEEQYIFFFISTIYAVLARLQICDNIRIFPVSKTLIIVELKKKTVFGISAYLSLRAVYINFNILLLTLLCWFRQGPALICSLL